MSDAMSEYRWERVVAQDNRMAIDTRTSVILITNDELCPSFAIRWSNVLSQRERRREVPTQDYIQDLRDIVIYVHKFRKLPNYSFKKLIFLDEYKIIRKTRITFVKKEKLLTDPHVEYYYIRRELRQLSKSINSLINGSILSALSVYDSLAVLDAH